LILFVGAIIYILCDICCRSPVYNKCSAVAEMGDHLATIDIG